MSTPSRKEGNSQQYKAISAPKSNLWTRELGFPPGVWANGYLQERGWLQRSCVLESPPKQRWCLPRGTLEGSAQLPGSSDLSAVCLVCPPAVGYWVYKTEERVFRNPVKIHLSQSWDVCLPPGSQKPSVYLFEGLFQFPYIAGSAPGREWHYLTHRRMEVVYVLGEPVWLHRPVRSGLWDSQCVLSLLAGLYTMTNHTMRLNDGQDGRKVADVE